MRSSSLLDLVAAAAAAVPLLTSWLALHDRPCAPLHPALDVFRRFSLLHPQRTPCSPCTDVHLTNYIFDGAKADLSKSLNMNPAFQVTHSFTLGASQPSPMGGPSTPGGPGTYNFNAVYATNRVRTLS